MHNDTARYCTKHLYIATHRDIDKKKHLMHTRKEKGQEGNKEDSFDIDVP